MGEREDAADVVCEAAEAWVGADQAWDDSIHDEHSDWNTRYEAFRDAGIRLTRAVDAWLVACRRDDDDD